MENQDRLTKKSCQPFQFSHYISLFHLKEIDLFSFVLVFYCYHIAQLKDLASLASKVFIFTKLRKKIHEWETEAPELRRAPRAIQGVSSESTEPRPPGSNSRTSAIQSSFLSIAPFYLAGDHFHMVNLFNHKNTCIQCMLIHSKKTRIFLPNYVHSVSVFMNTRAVIPYPVKQVCIHLNECK